jgi:hypothetical protein
MRASLGRKANRMAILRGFDDTKNAATCRSCGAPIVWIELTSGRRAPFDGRDLAFVRTALVDGRLVGEIDTTVSISHLSSCPDASTWRRRHER